MRPLAVVLVAASIGFGAEWSEIMRPEAPRAAVQGPAVGTVEKHGGYYYRLAADGWWHWCAECNGVGYEEFVRRWQQPARPVPTTVYVPAYAPAQSCPLPGR